MRGGGGEGEGAGDSSALLMTASMVHANNLTPPSRNGSDIPSVTTPVDDSRYAPI
jgi:hypothetical protein